MQNILQRLRFLLAATNEHGVHSPFVFDYVTKCLYTGPEYCREKSHNILLKSIAYFNPKHLYIPSGYGQLKNRILTEFPSVLFDYARRVGSVRQVGSGPYDILFTRASEAELLVRDASPVRGSSEENHIHNDSLLLVDGIRDNREGLPVWENIKQHRYVTVTVDLYDCGAVFFRKEQAKEHFKIRI